MFHKEGHLIIVISFILVTTLTLISSVLFTNPIVSKIVGIVSIFTLLLILQFFRNPFRVSEINDSLIISPVDGKVVAIEKVYEKEYFKEERIQVHVLLGIICNSLPRICAFSSGFHMDAVECTNYV